MISKSEEIELLPPWLDVILCYTSSTLNMSELCSSGLLVTRGSAYDRSMRKMNAMTMRSVVVIDPICDRNRTLHPKGYAITRTLSGLPPDHSVTV